MYQNVQTCILEVNSTRIGIKLPVDNVYCVLPDGCNLNMLKLNGVTRNC